jgi:hypothetical protein
LRRPQRLSHLLGNLSHQEAHLGAAFGSRPAMRPDQRATPLAASQPDEHHSGGRTHAAGDRVTTLRASSGNAIHGTVFDGPDLGAKVCDGRGRAFDGRPRTRAPSSNGDSAGSTRRYPLDRAMSLLGLSVAIADYRNRWFSASIASGSLEAVVSFGSLADTAWREFEKPRERPPRFSIGTCRIRLPRNRPVVHGNGSRQQRQPCCGSGILPSKLCVRRCSTRTRFARLFVTSPTSNRASL